MTPAAPQLPASGRADGLRQCRAIRPAVALLACLLLACLPSGACWAATPPSCTQAPWHSEREVFYKIFVRSFADSNGDRIGDFTGIEQRLGYLQSLGATSLLLTPIVASPYYHNYFATRFDDVDSGYGNLASFRRLVRAAHRHGMKILLDQEIQYVPPEHRWWKDSEGRPGSRFSRFILYDSPGNRDPDPGFLGSRQLRAYDGKSIRLAVVNLHEPDVRRYFSAMLKSWLLPPGTNALLDGVDGFRIDHMMDDLDGRGRLTGLVEGFWAPLLAEARSARPAMTVVAEQADWNSDGADLQTRGGVDVVYAFALRKAIAAIDGDAIRHALQQMHARTAAHKGQLVFIENHDTDRFASEVNRDPRKERLGAALVTLLKGSPLIYYGQEIGMAGRRLNLPDMPDGNDIPVREAFRWTRKVAGTGSALWYRGTGPWWTNHVARDDDGISVEEQQRISGSLLEFYRRALALRRVRPDLNAGSQCLLDVGDSAVLAVQRRAPAHASLLLLNLADHETVVDLSQGGWGSWQAGTRPRLLLANGAELGGTGSSVRVRLDPYSLALLAASP